MTNDLNEILLVVKPHAVGSHTISTIHTSTTQRQRPVNFSPIWMMIKISKPWTLFAKRDWPFTCQNWFRIISFFSCAEACGIPTASGRSLPLLLPTAAAAQWWLLPKGSGTPKGREPLSLLWKPDFKCKFSIDLVVNARYCLRTF